MDKEKAKEKALKIKMALLRIGLSQAQIARDMGLKRGTINRVINGHGKSKRVDEYISGVIKRSPQMSIRNDVLMDILMDKQDF